MENFAIHKTWRNLRYGKWGHGSGSSSCLSTCFATHNRFAKVHVEMSYIWSTYQWPRCQLKKSQNHKACDQNQFATDKHTKLVPKDRQQNKPVTVTNWRIVHMLNTALLVTDAVLCIRRDAECSVKKKGVGTHPKIAILKQLQSHFKAKCEKGVGTPFPSVPAPLHPCIPVSVIALTKQCRGTKQCLQTHKHFIGTRVFSLAST